MSTDRSGNRGAPAKQAPKTPKGGKVGRLLCRSLSDRGHPRQQGARSPAHAFCNSASPAPPPCTRYKPLTCPCCPQPQSASLHFGSCPSGAQGSGEAEPCAGESRAPRAVRYTEQSVCAPWERASARVPRRVWGLKASGSWDGQPGPVPLVFTGEGNFLSGCFWPRCFPHTACLHVSAVCG